MERWLSWKPSDRDALLELAWALKLGENHLRDLMDWLEEIALRDSVSICDILRENSMATIQSDPRLGRGDRLKRIKDRVRRLRFPRLSRLEDAIQSKIRELKLHPQVRLSVAPGLEGGALHVEFNASSGEELSSLIDRLAGAAKSGQIADIFVLLRGESEKEGIEAAR